MRLLKFNVKFFKSEREKSAGESLRAKSVENAVHVECIRLLRRAGYSYKQIGKLIGKSKSTVWQWLHGVTNPRRLEDIQRLMKLVEINYSKLRDEYVPGRGLMINNALTFSKKDRRIVRKTLDRILLFGDVLHILKREVLLQAASLVREFTSEEKVKSRYADELALAALKAASYILRVEVDVSKLIELLELDRDVYEDLFSRLARKHLS